MLGAGSLLFAWWFATSFVLIFIEPLTFAETAWFNFVAASTIGFGDVTVSFNGALRFLVEFVLLCVGLAIFALFIAEDKAMFVQTDAEALAEGRMRALKGLNRGSVPKKIIV